MPTKCGYVRVKLYSGTSKFFRVSVHRLVADMYLPNTNNLPQVNHKDGNKMNNHFNNLEWCTSSDNMKHARSIGIMNQIHLEKAVTNETGQVYRSSKFASQLFGKGLRAVDTAIRQCTKCANHTWSFV